MSDKTGPGYMTENFEDDDDHRTECPDCEGLGRITRGQSNGYTCTTCDGTGSVLDLDQTPEDRYSTDAERLGEVKFGFDKYMDKILISEGYGAPVVKPEDNPQRRRAAMHQDRPGNKTKFGAK